MTERDPDATSNGDPTRGQGYGPEQAHERAGEPEDSASRQPRARTAAEWITLAVSAGLILAVVALVVWTSGDGGGQPPTIVATPLTATIREAEGRYYLPIEVTKRGARAAEEVVVRAELTTAGETAGAEFTLVVLAAGETLEATVAFAADPAAGELAVGVVSFQ